AGNPPGCKKGILTLVYNDERSGVGIHPATLLRCVTLERHGGIPTPERGNDSCGGFIIAS
ncbi:MAG: hypothetical protein NTY50_00670, partial [Methylobacter sp.]|nr:hypothetical protein [Methylobacter sp.]